MIKEKVWSLKARGEPPKYVKYKKDGISSHLSKSRLPQIKEYEYYKCDYCEKEIILFEDESKRDGGKAKVYVSLGGKNTTLELALHNRCLNKVLNELQTQ